MAPGCPGGLAEGVGQERGAGLDLPAAIEDLGRIAADAPADLRRRQLTMSLGDSGSDLFGQVFLIGFPHFGRSNLAAISGVQFRNLAYPFVYERGRLFDLLLGVRQQHIAQVHLDQV